jgi:hypothetical protein
MVGSLPPRWPGGLVIWGMSGQLVGCAASPMCDNAAPTRPSPSVG